ncbi:hypothetical protein [Variovorax sp. LT1R16]|uniref:hypothetical protein n=1 Tax=Variovorax sp. LT1R16 TaxID=3443728 RepID=UPI003F460CFB
MTANDEGDGIEFSIRDGGGYGPRIVVHVTKAALERLDGAGPNSERNSLSVLARHVEALSTLATAISHARASNRVVLTAADIQDTAWVPAGKR